MTSLLEIQARDDAVACALAPGDFKDRTAALARLARDALTSREALPAGERLTFVDSPRTEHRLRSALEAEASCCPFLTIHLMRRDGALVLDLTGPDGAGAIIAELFV
jgi:hypothetical protein